ncbi:hypothetical protein ACFOLD_08335 [Kocuria carniphila]
MRTDPVASIYVVGFAPSVVHTIRVHPRQQHQLPALPAHRSAHPLRTM